MVWWPDLGCMAPHANITFSSSLVALQFALGPPPTKPAIDRMEGVLLKLICYLLGYLLV